MPTSGLSAFHAERVGQGPQRQHRDGRRSDPYRLRQPTGLLVRAQVKDVADMLEPKLPVVADMLPNAREEITAFADFPEAHWPQGVGHKSLGAVESRG